MAGAKKKDAKKTAGAIREMILDTAKGQKKSADPKWKDVEEALRSLDGKQVSLVSLSAGEKQFAAGGGGRGRYIVYATFDNQTFHNLVDPKKSKTEQVRLVTGGQEGIFPARQAVDLPRVLAAARSFFERQELEPTVEWQEG